MIEESEALEPLLIDHTLFDQLRSTLGSAGPAAAVGRLVVDRRASGDFPNLFYALLLKKRVELGVSPFPNGPSSDLPPETHEPYEQAIREAGREVGNALLSNRQYGPAWSFFRLLGELERMRDA